MFNFLNFNTNEEKKPVRKLISTLKPFARFNKKDRGSEKKGGDKESQRKKQHKDGNENRGPKQFSTKRETGSKNNLPLDIFIDFLGNKTIQDLKMEYSNIKSYVFPEHTRNAFDHNMNLNKYKDIICIDETRVALEAPGNHYYHANKVNVLGMKHVFICCQAPMNETIVDFWRLVIQYNVTTIVCLVNLIENGKPKCAQYWPGTEGSILKIKNINVQYDTTDTTEEAYIVRNLRVWREGENALPLRVKQIHWKDWPDKFVPSETYSLMKLVRKIRDFKKDETIVTHCSAGIGRTGTFVAINMIFTKITANEDFNIHNVVMSLRKQRAGAVQTESQYIFLFKVVVDYCLIINAFNIERKKILQKFVDEYKVYYENALNNVEGKVPAATPPGNVPQNEAHQQQLTLAQSSPQPVAGNLVPGTQEQVPQLMPQCVTQMQQPVLTTPQQQMNPT
uniref:Protein-tyrosine-phosphatase n=1 Tax=Parastrongyloides trichosuri TaxID=131310 RepID=A0A0N4ZMY0_PARTI